MYGYYNQTDYTGNQLNQISQQALAAQQELARRNQMLYQQYPQFSQPMQQQAPVQPQPQNQRNAPAINCLPVQSISEAHAHFADPLGALTVFVDAANGCIYTKQLKPDNTAQFDVFVKHVEQTQAKETPESPDILSVINARFENVEKCLEEIKGGLANGHYADDVAADHPNRPAIVAADTGRAKQPKSNATNPTADGK